MLYGSPRFLWSPGGHLRPGRGCSWTEPRRLRPSEALPLPHSQTEPKSTQQSIRPRRHGCGGGRRGQRIGGRSATLHTPRGAAHSAPLFLASRRDGHPSVVALAGVTPLGCRASFPVALALGDSGVHCIVHKGFSGIDDDGLPGGQVDELALTGPQTMEKSHEERQARCGRHPCVNAVTEFGRRGVGISG